MGKFLGRLIGDLVAWILWAIFFLPSRLLSYLALLWFGLVLWLHRKRCNRRGIIAGKAAARILDHRKLKTQIWTAQARFVDCYVPKGNKIILDERHWYSTSIGSLAIASHEVGHALQRHRWFVPWIARRLLAWPAGLALTLCLWAWIIGTTLQNQLLLLIAVGCFVPYMLLLLLELLCEFDASRRGVRALIRLDLLDRAESQIARRILRSALVTYIAFFAGAIVALTFLCLSIDWTTLNEHLPVIARHFQSLIENR